MKNIQVILHNTVKYFVLVSICLICNDANSIDKASLDFGKIAGNTWELEGVRLSFGDLNKKQSHFILSATKLKFPKPFNDLSLANIRCENLIWDQNNIDCRQGKASVKSVYWQSPSTDFTFHLNPKVSTFQLTNARLGDSRMTFNGELEGKDWRIQVEAKRVDKTLLNKLSPLMSLKPKLALIKQGNLNLTATLNGKDNKLLAFEVETKIEGVTGQTEDGKIAAENANLQFHIQGNAKNGLWHWLGEFQMLGGALYIEPVYLDVSGYSVSANAQGTTNRITSFTNIQSFSFQQPEVLRITGSAQGAFRNKVHVDKANIALQSDTLQGLLTTYINPFFTESPFSNLKVSGNLETRLSVVQQTLTDTAVNFEKLTIEDGQGRIAMQDGKGSVNWSANPSEQKQSEFTWRALALKGLPFETTKVKFTSRGNAFQLAEKVKLPVLNGLIAVDKFSWQGKQGDEPDISFAGSLENLSLESLSKTLGWTPLSGNISGQIPGVDYHNKVLSLGGELLIKVFNGTIKISQLKSSGLFGGFPRLESEIEFGNLDLDQLTSKFEFGAITGRLSGFVKNLVLENWHPVSFYAWFGTPDDDDSSHRISQKAVKNIASIGGGGTSDLLSRSFLGFFETFRYDKIGMGCYLHNGACQLMGLEAAGEGYYLIKGGFLPRIDVLGYNPRVNWDVLVERLKRVTSPEQAIIK